MMNRPYKLFLRNPDNLTTILITEGEYEGIEFSFINVRIERDEKDGNMYAHFEIIIHNKEFESKEEEEAFQEYGKSIFLSILEDAVREINENDSNENNSSQSN